jgi:hypothetical protein
MANWLFKLFDDRYSSMWYRAQGKSGAFHGLAFYCERGHYEIRYEAPAIVHCPCGEDHRAPSDVKDLPVRQLVAGANALPSNLISCGWDDEPERPEPEPQTWI